MSQSLPQQKNWAQVSYQDSIFPLAYTQNGINYGSFIATTCIDISENAGKVRGGKRMVLNTSNSDVVDMTGVPAAFWLLGQKIFTIAGNGVGGYVFSNNGNLIDPFTKWTTIGLQPIGFSGAGLNDAIAAGAENSGTTHTYNVQIDSVGTPDTFKWQLDGGAWTTGVAITGSTQLLANGVGIFFSATTGHTINNLWAITSINPPANIDSKLNDEVVSNNVLYVSCADSYGSIFTSVWRKTAGGTFSKFTTTAPNGQPNMLFSFGGNNPNVGRTYMTHSLSSIISWDKSDVIASMGSVNTITLNSISNDAMNVITKPLVASDRIWVLTLNSLGGRGNIYEWDGALVTTQKTHVLHSAGAVAGTLFHDVPYIMDTNGNLQFWNGATFKTVASLYRKNKKLLYNPIGQTNDRFCNPNSMSVVDEKILIEIDNRNYDATSSIEDTITAGIYEFDPLNPSCGLIHKHGFGLSKSGGLIQDFGALRIAGAGAITEMNIPSNGATRNGTFVAGCAYYADATIVKNGIFYDDSNDTLQKAGSFITLKFEAEGAKQQWNSFYTLYKSLLNSTDQMVVKCRVVEAEAVEGSLTFTSPTTFTILNSAVDISKYWTAGVGGEVEFTQGIGSNICAHITNAVLAGGTWTVTIDQSVPMASGTAKARFNSWINIGNITYSLLDTVFKSKPEVKSSWLQIKLWYQWSNKNEIERLSTVDVNMLPTA